MLKSRGLFGTSFNLLVLLGGSLGPPIFILVKYVENSRDRDFFGLYLTLVLFHYRAY